MRTAYPTRNFAPSRPASSSASALLQRKCACGQHTIGCEHCEACSKEKRVLRRKSDAQAGQATAPSAVYDVLNSPGQALAPAARAFFEPRFGHDFSGVRVHADPIADRSVAEVGAHAWAVGSDIAFGAGKYAPSTPQGAGLLAHELAHVVQQHNAPEPAALHIGDPDDAYEREADRQALTMVSGGFAQSLSSPAEARLQRSLKSGFLDVALFIPRLFGLEYFPVEDLREYLAGLKQRRGPEDHWFSDNKARACVKRESEFGPYDVQTKVWLIQEMLGGHTSRLDEGAIVSLLRRSQADRPQMVSMIGRDQLWSKFSGSNRRIIEAMTMTATDAGAALESRLRNLDPGDIRDYATNATDPSVRESVRRALALAQMTPPVPGEAAITPGGEATLVINGWRVTVRQDRIVPNPANHAITKGQFSYNAPPTIPVTPENENQPVGFTPAPVDLAVEIWTEFASEKQKQDKPTHGVGTRPQDQQTVRFHERGHGGAWLDFLRNNPPPAFAGTADMHPAQFNQAIEQWRTAVRAYQRRIYVYAIKAGDCVGKLPTNETLRGEAYTAEICYQE